VIPALIALAVVAAAPAPSPAPAGAAVAIQRADDADPVVLAAGLRMRSELAAAGYTGQIVPCTVDPRNGPVDCPQSDALDSISLARAGDATSIFAASVLPNGRRSWRRLQVTDADGGSDPALVAVRAVELLRDVQVQLAASAALDPEDPTPLEPFAQPPPHPPNEWRLLAGVSMLIAPWSTQSALFPVFGGSLGAGRSLGSRAALLLQAAGPFICGLPIAADSSAIPADRLLFEVLGLVSLRVGLRSSGSGPFAAARAGARYFNVRLGASNLNGSSASTIAPLAGGGVGYTFAWSPRLFASLEAHVDVSAPVQVVDAGNQPLVHTDRLFWGLDLTTAIALP
jgi:hypothetical protein